MNLNLNLSLNLNRRFFLHRSRRATTPGRNRGLKPTATIAASLRDAGRRNALNLPKALRVVLLLLALPLSFSPPACASPSATPSPAPAQVISVTDSRATAAFEPRLERVRAMVQKGLLRLTHKSTIIQAWRTLLSTNDIVGIKVYSRPGPNSGTRPAVVAAVVEELLSAGLPATNILVWDKDITDLKLAGFVDLAKRYGVRVAGSLQAGYDSATFYESPILGNLVWGDLEFEKGGSEVGRKSFFSKLVTHGMTKIVNVTPLLNHNSAGVSGNFYSLVTGSVDNFARFEGTPERLATAVPEIYNLPPLADRVVLNIVDALICQYEGAERSLLHYSATLNQLRFSRDPVALDVLSLQELERQRQATRAPEVKEDMELYNNAALLQLGVSDLKKVQVEELR
ncbi:MAG: hypothetical protein C5B50_24040 [Verrucomicrobia bacterium]|nr:MAG: hypothetical protein C5B50_24040 [Verrucomicrobiota bacterium]